MAKIYFKDSSESISAHTIFCVGRNYAAHAAELRNPLPQAPIIFTKPLTAIVYDGQFIELPVQSSEVHYEAEVVVLIGKTGKHISLPAAPDFIAGYGIGIDVTARDIQEQAKAKSHPWTVAKGFDTFAPLSSFVKPAKIPDPANLNFQLRINGEIRQNGNTGNMLFPFRSSFSTFQAFLPFPGDLIFSGTPEGVGPLHPDDLLEATLGDSLVSLKVGVKNPR